MALTERGQTMMELHVVSEVLHVPKYSKVISELSFSN